MCPDRDGNIYLWKPPLENSPKRCAHITIGPTPADLAIANKLLESDCEFLFSQIDYKKVGRFNPHITKTLNNGMKLLPK